MVGLQRLEAVARHGGSDNTPDIAAVNLYLAEGLGHAICSLEDDSTVMYLCSATYDRTGTAPPV